MIRLATIGTNTIVDKFLKAAEQFPDLVYETVYSRSEENARAFAKKHGAAGICTDLKELAEREDIDAVYIASPNSLHYEQASLMLSHGKHVLCEKPITSNARELSQLLETALESGVILMEAMRNVYDPAFLAVEQNLNRLGKIRRVMFQYCQYSSRYDQFQRGVIENAFKPEFSNGALMDIGVYCVHPMIRLFGMPKHIYGTAVKLDNGIDGAGTIVADYDGMQAVLMYSKISDHKVPSEIQGEEGTMVITRIGQPYDVRFYDRSGKEEVLAALPGPCGMEGEIREWIRLIDQKAYAEAAVFGQDSLRKMQVMDEARRQMELVFPADRKQSDSL